MQQIECEATFRAQPDCLQWHTGISGTFESFNYGTNNVIPQNNAYQICIRQEEGYCTIAYDTNPLSAGDRPFYLNQAIVGNFKGKVSFKGSGMRSPGLK